MDLDIVFLGTSASAPTAGRAPMAVLVRRGGERLLFDCGEGTQRQLMRSSLGLPDLEEIFLTHFHADHYLGLPGMLKTFALRQRELPLTVYGPPGLRDLFSELRRVFGKVAYPLELVEVRPGEALERDGYRILVFPVHHGVSAVGYAVAEDDRPGRFDVETADTLGVPSGPERGALQRGESITLDDGRVVTPDQVLGEARTGRRIVLTGDTAPVETVRVLAEGADVLVHEATFSDEERDRAADTLHSTARQAAETAAAAGVRLLALTHLSPRYFGPELLDEARAVFPNVVAPRDFDVVEVPFAERGEPQLVRKGARPPRGDEAPSELPGAAA
ncbi:MAG TPA: ribonuclease Z [Gaiellaceae bacterium]|nr:ribonuclease Z [Gaiellaceae bacterium]